MNTFKILLAIGFFSISCSGISIALTANPSPTEISKQIREEFLHAWNGYKTHAWGCDELKPLTKTCHNWGSHSLLITPIEALDTMIIMDLHEEADRTREYIATHLSFDHNMFVNTFETTIRVLGGLISSYQMTEDKRLLDLAEDLGRRLLPAFSSSTGMPYSWVNLRTGVAKGHLSNAAEIGTSILEFGTLSKLVGDPIFHEVSLAALLEVYKYRSSIGLLGSKIDVNTGEWKDDTSQIGGGSDSYYEYLLKCWLLFGDEKCKRQWEKSFASLTTHLLHKNNRAEASIPSYNHWFARVDMKTGTLKNAYIGALDAFFPGCLVLYGYKKQL